MLAKLIKYDLKNVLKFLSIFYILGIIFSLLCQLFSGIENSTAAFVISEIFKGAAMSMLFSTIINNCTRVWVRFSRNFYADEAYLTHTLPIKKSVLYLSKFLTLIISLIISLTVCAAIFIICFYSKDFLTFIKQLILPFAEMLGGSLWSLCIILIFILFLEFINIIQCGFTGIILGHRRNTSKSGFSVLFTFIVYTASQLIVLLAVLLSGIFDNSIFKLFTTNAVPGGDTLKIIVVASTAIYLIVSATLYLINVKLFTKGVNID